MQNIHHLRRMRLDIIQAIKRGLLHQGIVVGDQAAAPPKPKSEAKKPEAKSKALPKEEKENKASESYAEKVAGGESDKEIEEKGEDSTDKLKSEVPGSKTASGPEDLQELAAKSQDVLFEATTVWPFTLFPDTIKLDREKLTIANRFFWRVADITSVPVGEIMSAEVIVGPFFGSLHLTFRFFANNERSLKFLTRNDAVEMQRMIHGYIIAHRREIDVSSVSKEELIKLLTELGQGASD